MQASKQQPVKFVKMLGARRRQAAGRTVAPATVAIQNLSLLQGLVRQSRQGASVQLTTQNALSFPMPHASAGEPISQQSSIFWPATQLALNSQAQGRCSQISAEPCSYRPSFGGQSRQCIMLQEVFGTLSFIGYGLSQGPNLNQTVELQSLSRTSLSCHAACCRHVSNLKTADTMITDVCIPQGLNGRLLQGH